MKKTKVNPKKNSRGTFFENAKKTMSPSMLKKADAKAKIELFNIRLSTLREQFGIKQSDIEGFSQTSVSKLEAREDMKISTLLQYLEGLNMDVEIIVHPKGKNTKDDEIELLNTGS